MTEPDIQIILTTELMHHQLQNHPVVYEQLLSALKQAPPKP